MNTKDIILVAVGALLFLIALFSKKDKEGEVKKIVGLGLVTLVVLVAVVAAGYFL
ncbi:MAG: hypothetical protein UDQ92_05565 [Lachnospiraceae bacterium]|nr:hypothetical protein [Lachnospiraceae bacterium]